MRRMGLFQIAVGGFVALGLVAPVRTASAQTKEARGAVTAVSDSSLIVRAGAQDLTFAVDGKTRLEAFGAGRRTREAQSAGGTGIKITDFVKAGGAVLVGYREANGANHADWVRPVSSAGAGGGSIAESPKAVTGTVTSLGTDSLTIASEGKNWTFAVDTQTTVSARGAGSATRAAGGRLAFTKLVGQGDRVSVTYRDADKTPIATEIRIVVDAR